MRTAEEVVKEINSTHGDGDEQGLRNTAALLELLQAWPSCPVIHVAGTNGKGSVCAMLSSVLTEAGYRTGLYTSPFLQTYAERIRLNGVPLPDTKLAMYGSDVLDAAEKLKAYVASVPVPDDEGLLDKMKDMVSSTLSEADKVQSDYMRLNDMMEKFSESIRSISDNTKKSEFIAGGIEQRIKPTGGQS